MTTGLTPSKRVLKNLIRPKNHWTSSSLSPSSSSPRLDLGWPRRIGSPSEVRRFAADGSIFGRKSDPIAETEAKIFENPIRFNQIKLTYCLIGLKRIGLNAIFRFFRSIGSDSFLFFVGSEEKNCFRSDPMATLGIRGEQKGLWRLIPFWN